MRLSATTPRSLIPSKSRRKAMATSKSRRKVMKTTTLRSHLKAIVTR